ncbi:hypothetical protein Tco_0594840 [Tanacetum coccineum]
MRLPKGTMCRLPLRFLTPFDWNAKVIHLTWGDLTLLVSIATIFSYRDDCLKFRNDILRFQQSSKADSISKRHGLVPMTYFKKRSGWMEDPIFPGKKGKALTQDKPPNRSEEIEKICEYTLWDSSIKMGTLSPPETPSLGMLSIGLVMNVSDFQEINMFA